VSSSGFLRPMPAAPKVPLEGQQAAKALSEAYGAVAEFVRPSVVQITVQKKSSGVQMVPGMPNMRRFQIPPRGNGNGNGNGNQLPPDFEDMLRKFLRPDGAPEQEQFGGRSMGVGSGFVYDGHGHIVTNNHVVENAEKIKVTFYDGAEAEAKVVGTDKQTDVAVIKVKETHYPALPRGDSGRLKVGEMVMAVGSPFGFSQSVTSGIISALERNAVGINEYESFIQTDAPINRGNSGGPLVNMNGEVIGVNSAIVSGGSGNDGIGFAIPMKLANSVAEMLIKDGKVHYARIGIRLAPLTPDLARQFGLDSGTKGVLVEQVFPGTPADKAGLKAGDVITSFAGEKVADHSSFRLKVATSEVAHSYEIGFLRDGAKKTASITPAPADKVAFDLGKEEEKDTSAKSEPAKTAISAFGMEVQPLTSELAKPLGLPADVKGVVVAEVKENGPAAEAGIREGDVITKVVHDRRIQPLTGVKQFQDLASKSDELAIYVQRGKAGQFVTLSKSAK
jgi:serine protease Do